MSEGWRRLAQAARGEALVHQAAQAFYSEGRWTLLVLAQRDGDHVRVLTASQGGQPLALADYELEQAPCRVLYQAERLVDSLIYCPNLRRYAAWPLARQFELGCYLGRKLDLPAALGEFHLFLMDKLSRSEKELPQRLMNTVAERLAADLLHQAERAELQTLRQLQQAAPFAFARLAPWGTLHQVSKGMAELLGAPSSELNGQPLADHLELGTGLSVKALLARTSELRQPCQVQLANGHSRTMALQLVPLDSHLGYLLSLAPTEETDPVADPSMPLSNHQQLHSRLHQELSRLHRNHQVAALFFIGIETENSPEPAAWAQLAERVRPLLRSEDLVAQLDDHHLAVLTACFDHHGEPPRAQMNAIAGKLHQQVVDWQAPLGGKLVFRGRVVTPWDNDPMEVLDPGKASDWAPSPVESAPYGLSSPSL
ncbi:hypothetical protein [Ferrimonas balearica]|uniref:hypothetical protein n=1 Tax=Ferrimonas balearica TaxID=44012 RepID=UPI001C9979F9|nr:hypothetical protein [Ferrimonas balearica]MBY5991638.1 hypothetical protein [Ferrimonas balearica]